MIAANRHDPAEAERRDVVAEPNLDIAGPAGRQFHLRGLKKHAGKPEAQRTLQRVVCAAGNDTGSCPHRAAAGERDRNPVAIGDDARYALAQDRGGAGRASPLEQPKVEEPAIDDDCFDRRRGVFDGEARRREEPRAGQRVQDDVAGEIELGERLLGEHARAVNGIAAGVVFLVERNVESFAGEPGRGAQAPRATADDDDIPHAFGLNRALGWLSSLDSIRPSRRGAPSVPGT